MEVYRQVPEAVSFGWGAPKISEQFEGCGLTLDQLQHFDRDSEAVSRLSVRGVIPRSEAEKAYKRVQKRLEGDLLKARRAPSTSGEG